MPTPKLESVAVPVGLGGAVLGLAMGGFWQVVASQNDEHCAELEQTHSAGVCKLGALVWGPEIVVSAAVVGLLVCWFALATAEVRPKALLVLAVPVLTPVAALLFGAFGMLGWFRIVVPAVVLGLGMAGSATLATARRPASYRWDLRYPPNP
ncbi:hypothetical protein [Kutzneria buriramensis]|uniref:Uncharacterized protein n=1 Tax=Kutzneria buriramensis TaxID=1045776 RepID=A0A3E0H1M1_9PSEU|nr:hypothetical protein [Kutzneria buriramensis]REH36173.1 hypothetical protein BCF44_11642 [Kutzneria buriramensis]